MKRLLYPKTYARLVGFIKEDKSSFTVRNGRVVFRSLWPNHIYIFETDTGETIEAKYPRTSGHTPNSLDQKFREFRTKHDRIKLVNDWDYFLTIEKPMVKLYQRPQDNGRWSYRHVDQ